MIDFDFEIAYKKGSEMPADNLSHNHVDAIQLEDYLLQKEQENYWLLKEFQMTGNYRQMQLWNSPRQSSALWMTAHSGEGSIDQTNPPCTADAPCLHEASCNPGSPQRYHVQSWQCLQDKGALTLVLLVGCHG